MAFENPRRKVARTDSCFSSIRYSSIVISYRVEEVESFLNVVGASKRSLISDSQANNIGSGLLQAEVIKARITASKKNLMIAPHHLI